MPPLEFGRAVRLKGVQKINIMHIVRHSVIDANVAVLQSIIGKVITVLVLLAIQTLRATVRYDIVAERNVRDGQQQHSCAEGGGREDQ